MAWFLLFIAGIEEIIAAIAMKYIDGTKEKMAHYCDDCRICFIFLLPFTGHANPAIRCCLCRLDRYRQHRRNSSQPDLV